MYVDKNGERFLRLVLKRIDEVIPKIFAENTVVFAFVGRNPPLWSTECSLVIGSKFLGNVKDVRQFIADSEVVVVLIFRGS